MHNLTRRDAIKTGVGIAVGSSLSPSVAHAFDHVPQSDVDRPRPTARATPGGQRERLLLDRDWKFHLGHASDPRRDFGFGGNEAFGKDGELFPNVSEARYDDSKWSAVSLPHDWAIELPFVEDKHTRGHGYKPLGRDYPDASIGWYRRSFNLAAADSDRRISLEFDGVS